MTLFERISKCKSARAQAVNPNLIQVSMSKGKNPAYLNIAVEEQTSEGFIYDDSVGILVFIPREEWEQSEPKDGEIC